MNMMEFGRLVYPHYLSALKPLKPPPITILQVSLNVFLMLPIFILLNGNRSTIFHVLHLAVLMELMFQIHLKLHSFFFIDLF